MMWLIYVFFCSKFTLSSASLQLCHMLHTLPRCHGVYINCYIGLSQWYRFYGISLPACGMWHVACGMWFAHVIQLQRRVSCAACPPVPVCLCLCLLVCIIIIIIVIFILFALFMAFCRASGHVLVITICHWFPVNADESRDGSIRLPCPAWLSTLHSALFPCSTLAAPPALLSHYASLCCCPAVASALSLALAFSLSSLLSFPRPRRCPCRRCVVKRLWAMIYYGLSPVLFICVI